MENDRRSYPRVSCNGLAAVELGNQGACPAHVLDLSREGCHLVLDNPQQIERNTVLDLAFEIDQIAFRARAQAKSIRSDTSIGFSFLDMTEKSRADLSGLVGLLAQFTAQPAQGVRPGGAAS